MKSRLPTSLPFDILHKITENLTPLNRLAMVKANITVDPLITSQDMRQAKIWGAIFKFDTWINIVMKTDYGMSANPEPGLMGKKMTIGNKKRINLILLINDWGGDIRSISDLFFKSLQDYVPDDHDKNLIHFKDSLISLHIQDAVSSSQELSVQDPRKYICTKRGKLSTYVSYYSDPNIVELGPDDIGGIEGRKSKKAIREVCCVKEERCRLYGREIAENTRPGHSPQGLMKKLFREAWDDIDSSSDSDSATPIGATTPPSCDEDNARLETLIENNTAEKKIPAPSRKRKREIGEDEGQRVKAQTDIVDSSSSILAENVPRFGC
ncbi:hypothetical protein FAGAP_4381 [Fusarium agapanthi]|uniref:Uncharacterized protein n=1 Tax=Fusarium agapanthi TaxID=1803897 RepID=A0A9P5BDI9_9HYPO|nr:hypothetical protein FAGAP_4381 [Fusarium agapanthi]